MLVNKKELYNILLANKNIRTGAIEFLNSEEWKNLIFEVEINELDCIVYTHPLSGDQYPLVSEDTKVNYIPDLKQYILDKFLSKFSKNELLNLHALLDGGLDLCDILAEHCCEVAPEYFTNPEGLKEEI
jgi:hypothetical protein